MKSILIFMFIALTTVQCMAQLDTEAALYTAKVERYRKMKTAGIFLSVAGGILTAVGISTLSNSSYNTVYYSGGYSQTTTTGNPGAGSLQFLLGTAGLGAGIPLWAVGSHSQKKYLRKLEEMSLGLKLNQASTGLSFTYRF